MEMALLCALLASNIFWMLQVQKLVNKLMSRSFYDYNISNTIKPRESKKPAAKQDATAEDTSASIQFI
jgi:hypothetical protein